MDQWSQLGVGGVLTLLILREVFAFLQKRQRQEELRQTQDRITAGDQPTEYYLLIYQRIEGKIDTVNEKLDQLLKRAR